MKFKHICFIINPASGKPKPILSIINQALEGTGIDWDIYVTKKNRGAGEIATELLGTTDLIAVYGGDGCATEVATALHGSKTPLAIIPGGTANIMARELGIPLETEDALALLIADDQEVQSIDMGLFNGQPFLLRVNIGIMADIVLHADRSLKNSVGQLAYGITAIKTIAQAEPVKYYLEIDGVVFEETGVSLTVTNSGHVGIGDFALQPGISITDGLLDVILMKDASLLSVLKVAGSTLLQNETEALIHWQCKQIMIRMDQAHSLICDDREETTDSITITVVPASILILTAKSVH